MAAHLRQLPQCHHCAKPATHALHDTHNALINHYCGRHAAKALIALQKRETQ